MKKNVTVSIEESKWNEYQASADFLGLETVAAFARFALAELHSTAMNRRKTFAATTKAPRPSRAVLLGALADEALADLLEQFGEEHVTPDGVRMRREYLGEGSESYDDRSYDSLVALARSEGRNRYEEMRMRGTLEAWISKRFPNEQVDAVQPAGSDAPDA